MSRRSYLRFEAGKPAAAAAESRAAGEPAARQAPAAPARQRKAKTAAPRNRPVLLPRRAAESAVPAPAEESLRPSWLQRALGLVRSFMKQHAPKWRELQLLEMQPMGERRFVAVVRAGERRFLIGGGSGTVALLAELDQEHGGEQP
jgi:hypothetical protein